MSNINEVRKTLELEEIENARRMCALFNIDRIDRIKNSHFPSPNAKSLTESMGQEVIEIGAPIKDLPDLEEEPSVENEQDKITTTTIQAATKKDMRKYSVDINKKVKDVDKIDGKKQEDDEARIEKELADIYKDSVDYKADSAEVTVTTKQNVTVETEKPVARARNQFKFQPDSNDPEDIARFRTSIDDLTCSKTKLAGVTKAPTSGCRRVISDILFLTAFTFCVIF
ncbi:unnamed protein product, partial [Brenthis ino]